MAAPLMDTAGTLTESRPADRVARIGRPGRFGSSPWAVVVIALAILYFCLPLYASGVFAFSNGKTFTIQPLFDGLTDSGFQASMILSILYAAITTGLAILIIAPTAYLVELRFQHLRGLVEFLAILPFVIPPIILSLGLSEVYGLHGIANVLASPWAPALLIFGYVILSLPFVFRAIDNALRAIDVRTLTEAAQSLGAGPVRTFAVVIVPSIRGGLVAAALLAFTTAMGEFTLAALLGFATFPVYLTNLNGFSPRAASSLVLVSFVITWAGVLALGVVARRTPGARSVPVVR
jgi:putative spermidine/putrescine transport system permease protein